MDHQQFLDRQFDTREHSSSQFCIPLLLPLGRTHLQNPFPLPCEQYWDRQSVVGLFHFYFNLFLLIKMKNRSLYIINGDIFSCCQFLNFAGNFRLPNGERIVSRPIGLVWSVWLVENSQILLSIRTVALILAPPITSTAIVISASFGIARTITSYRMSGLTAWRIGIDWPVMGLGNQILGVILFRGQF